MAAEKRERGRDFHLGFQFAEDYLCLGRCEREREEIRGGERKKLSSAHSFFGACTYNGREREREREKRKKVSLLMR